MSTPPKEKKAKEITAKTVKAALQNREKGKRTELTDSRCKGLQFRVTEDTAIWTVRARLFGKQRRWTIGNSDVSPDDARERAGEVRAWCRRGSNPDKLVTQYMTGISIAKQIHFSAERPARSWDWEEALDNFLDHISKNRAPETYDDYARTLGGRWRLDPKKRHAHVPELSRFKGKRVNTIAREDIAECVADICKRAYAQGLHTLRILGSMWSFLGDDTRRRQTSVAANLLLRVKPPEKPQPVIVRPALSALQLFDNDQEDKRRDVPAPLELGRAVAIARSGALGERASLAVQLLAFSLQRRRAIIGSYAMDYKIMAEWNDPEADIVWIIPPFMRKRSDKRRANFPHLVVLTGAGAKTVRRLDEIAMELEYPYHFPVRVRPGKKTKNPYADPSFVNHALQFMPGVDISPHACRRGFGTHGQRELGLSISDCKLILDHSEGAPPGDVTAERYALDPMLQKKKQIITLWTNWLELQVQAAIAADPGLLNAEALRDEIYRARYGEARWLRRKSQAEFFSEAAE
ncbi:Arm DNA-binding domain-containing protein [Bradyrhizobium sp. WSM1743]|uniref:Arm DNA-binding domain-containing protein n=1 Tax=Bradyrhizobium sp. WSM1743 TaxID=318996 RepID=UPI000420A3C4|nr:Arm DNA-binding domain-containing protein [Bradyrhizobium sp. WSM1743]